MNADTAIEIASAWLEAAGVEVRVRGAWFLWWYEDERIIASHRTTARLVASGFNPTTLPTPWFASRAMRYLALVEVWEVLFERLPSSTIGYMPDYLRIMVDEATERVLYPLTLDYPL